MSNQRKEERRKLVAFTPVYEVNNKIPLGYLGDLTLLGALVVGESQVESNKLIKLKIEFPSDIPNLITPDFIIPARIAWCRKDKESPQYYNIGIEFTEVSPQHTRIIQSILDRYHFRHNMSDPEFKALD